MHNRLEDFGGKGETVAFAHANGLPPGSYRQLISALTSHFHVIGIKHRPLWSTDAPKPNINWHTFTQDLIDAVQSLDTPVWIIGHSLGATTSTLAALQQPDLFKGLILLDPVFLPIGLIAALSLTPKPLRLQIPIIKKTLNRPDDWPDKNQAFNFHRRTKIFKDVSDEVLWHYIEAGTVERNSSDSNVRQTLAYSKHWEAHIYQTPPWMWPRLRKITHPVLALRGETSDVLTAAVWQRWQRIQPTTNFVELKNCGHIFPLEKPQETAQIILDYLNKQQVNEPS